MAKWFPRPCKGKSPLEDRPRRPSLEGEISKGLGNRDVNSLITPL